MRAILGGHLRRTSVDICGNQTGSMLTAIVLSYLSELLRQALVFDFDLPAAVPPRLLICAAVFTPRGCRRGHGSRSARRVYRPAPRG